jgi:hypothetical protein
MAFSKREHSFCVLEYARTSSVVTAVTISSRIIYIVQCYSTEDAGQIVNWFIYNPHVRNYNHLFHSYTFTQFTNTAL